MDAYHLVASSPILVPAFRRFSALLVHTCALRNPHVRNKRAHALSNFGATSSYIFVFDVNMRARLLNPAQGSSRESSTLSHACDSGRSMITHLVLTCVCRRVPVAGEGTHPHSHPLQMVSHVLQMVRVTSYRTGTAEGHSLIYNCY